MDVTNEVYGHRALEDLRKEIEKIPCLKCVENGTSKINSKRTNIRDNTRQENGVKSRVCAVFLVIKKLFKVIEINIF